jgi:diacylglycerol kinase family enzyme
MAQLTSISGRKDGHRRPERVAILLNANARSVDEKLRQEIARFVPNEDVFYSRSLSDARAIASSVVARGYTTLLTGGGDGTFVGYVNEVRRAVDTAREHAGASVGNAALQLAPEPVRAPKFGVLHLGTGNALAGMLGASPSRVGVVEDILRARAGDVIGTRRLHLVDAGGKRAPFAGCGLDAAVLNDYNRLKNTLGVGPAKALATGLFGYAVSISGMSIPDYVRKLPMGAARLTLINEGTEAAHQISPDGRICGKPIAPGEVMYEGPAHVAAGSTVPTYGFGLTVFPHAPRATGRMQLRISAMPLRQLLGQLPAIWKGRTPPGFIDFFAHKVRMKWDRLMPLQVGGDAEGYRDEVVLDTDPRPVEMLDFRVHA